MPEAEAIASIAHIGATAAVCFNDLMALAVWEVAEQLGLRVPDDLSLVGMDNSAAATERGLTSIAHSFRDVGRLAMEAWIELSSGADATHCCKTAPVSLVERTSVRALADENH